MSEPESQNRPRSNPAVAAVIGLPVASSYVSTVWVTAAGQVCTLSPLGAVSSIGAL